VGSKKFNLSVNYLKNGLVPETLRLLRNKWTGCEKSICKGVMSKCGDELMLL